MTDDAADGNSTEKPIQNIESDVPAGSSARDETAIDAVPQRKSRASAVGFELSPDIIVVRAPL